jgi:hypothetical protein
MKNRGEKVFYNWDSLMAMSLCEEVISFLETHSKFQVGVINESMK